MPMSKNVTASQRQGYNKRWYVRKVVMETLEARLWEALRHAPDGKSKFYVWRDEEDLSRFHVIINTTNTKAPPYAWIVDIFLPEVADPKTGEPFLGEPVLTIWAHGRDTPLARYTGDTNRRLAGYASDTIISDLLSRALPKITVL